MLHQLLSMLERREYHQCVDLANFLLSMGTTQPVEAVQIHQVLSRSYLALTEPQRSIAAAEAALVAAEALGRPDLTADLLYTLGLALEQLQRYDEAVRTLYRALQAESDPNRQGAILADIAGVQRRLGALELSAETYALASARHAAAGDEARAYRCSRQALSAYLKLANADRALPLLTRNDAYIRAHPEDREAALAHALDWAAFFQAAGEPDRSIRVAFQVLELSTDLAQQAQAQLLLCQGARSQDRPLEALSFAMAARISAIDARAYVLEFEAGEAIHQLLQQYGPSLLHGLDRELQTRGVDLYQYISEDWYWRSIKSREGGTEP